jgi:hypothetical protein
MLRGMILNAQEIKLWCCYGTKMSVFGRKFGFLEKEKGEKVTCTLFSLTWFKYFKQPDHHASSNFKPSGKSFIQ